MIGLNNAVYSPVKTCSFETVFIQYFMILISQQYYSFKEWTNPIGLPGLTMI